MYCEHVPGRKDKHTLRESFKMITNLNLHSEHLTDLEIRIEFNASK